MKHFHCSIYRHYCMRTGQQVSLSPDEAAGLIRKGISELNKGSVILEK